MDISRVFPVVLVATVLSALADSATNLIGNGTFDRDVEYWQQWFAPGNGEGEGIWTAAKGNGCFEIHVRRCEKVSSIQIYAGGFPIQKGAWYTVEFRVRSDEPGEIKASLMGNGPPYGNLGFGVQVATVPEWRSHCYLVRTTDDREDARLDFFLPVGVFCIDDVRVVQLDGPPERLPVESVRAGRGIKGPAAGLIDGDMKVGPRLGGYPDLPVFITLDLGLSRPVGMVTLYSADQGRHLSLDGVSVEVSEDGQEWREWTKAVKSVGTREGGRQNSVFSASGASVPVQFVRLRIERLKNSAPLTEVEVFAAPSADRAELEVLPLVPGSAQLAFLGWDYEALGYDASPGERISLRFANQGDSPVTASLDWKLETYAGVPVASGNVGITVAVNETGDCPIAAPDDLAAGHYRIRASFTDGGGHEDFHFDFRRAAGTKELPRLSLGAYLDCQDPEGWVRLCAGPLEPFLDVRRRAEAPSDVQAVLVMAEEWGPDDARVKEVVEHVRAGGTALCFGTLSPAFDDLIPVRIRRDEPRLPALTLPDPGSLGMEGNGLRQRGVNVEAKPGSEILSRWSDGTPCMVMGTFGQGRVVYTGAAMGRAWTDAELTRCPADRLTFPLLYRLLVGEKAAQAARKLLDADDAYVWKQEPAELSFGRFGWRIGEGCLVENIDQTGTLHCPATTDPWKPTVPGRPVVRAETAELNWLGKRLDWVDDAGSTVMSTTLSMGSPCMRWETSAQTLDFDLDATAMFWNDVSGVSRGETDTVVTGEKLAEGWFVFVNGGDAVRDAPKLIQFQKRPERIQFSAGHVSVTFPGACGCFWTGRLYGIRRFGPGETTQWTVAGKGEEIARQARFLCRLNLAFPTAVDEQGAPEQGDDSNAWVVSSRFTVSGVNDDFGSRPLTAAPLPPILSLYRGYTKDMVVVQREAEILDTGIATKYGPLEVLPGQELVYALTLPADEHYGVVPVSAQQDIQDIVDSQGLLALGIKKPSGGLVSGNSSNYLADLREYMSAGQPANPFASSCIDLYKWWYCFPSVAGRPAYSPEAREQIDEHYRYVYRDTLDFHAYKTLIRYRREPWTGRDYTVSFIWPVSWVDGVRYFVDQNESAAVIAYCFWTYAQYYGDWATIRSNWHLIRWLWNYLPRVQDWVLMCSSNLEYFGTAGIDMLNSEFPGNLALARMAARVGDPTAEHLARHLAAKAMVPAAARFFLPDYTRQITAEGDPWREAPYFWSMTETGFGGSKDVLMRGDTHSILQLGIGMYDTSKGTGPEIALLYKAAAPTQVEAYERSLLEAEAQYGDEVGWAHLMSRAFLGWPQNDLAATVRRSYAKHPSLGWQSTKYPHNLAAMCAAGSGFYLRDWFPAAYIEGAFDSEHHTARLLLENTESLPVELRAYAAFPVESVECNGTSVQDWEYNPDTGDLRVPVSGSGRLELCLWFAATRTAVPSPYTPIQRMP